MRQQFLILTGIVVVTVACYAPIRHAGFVYEDVGVLPGKLFHQPVKAVGNLDTVFSQEAVNSVAKAAQPMMLPNRFLTQQTYDWDARHDHGPLGYHVVNIAIHMTVGMVMFALVRRLRPWSTWAAPIAASIVLLHPLQTESAAYIGQRTELVVGLGVVLALYGATFRWWRWGAIVPGLLIAAMGKERGIVAVPLTLLFMYRVYPLRVPVKAIVTMALVAGLVMWRQTFSILSVRWSLWNPFAWLAMQSAAWWTLYGTFLVPIHQTVDHDFMRVPSSLAIVCLALVVLALIVAVWSWRDAVWSSFAILWVAVALLPRFAVPFTEFLNEHDMYVPIIGLSLALSMAFTGRRRVVMPLDNPMYWFFQDVEGE